MSDEKQIDEALAWCADRDRVKRLEELVRKAWPNEALELCCDNSEPESPNWFTRQYGHGNFTSVISIDHPKALDALEAALLVLNGPEALREFAFGVVERELREVSVNTVKVMYWDKGASDTINAYNDDHSGHGTLLQAIDALKAKT